MMHGIINVYKERGFTSHDVVAKLRGILRQKKIGHTGTLDPDATGVLPVCLGQATKLCELLTDKRKEYVAEFVLGKETDTQDISGKVLAQRQMLFGEAKEQAEDGILYLTEEELRLCIQSFVGEYMQVPPMYSAKKVGGRKLVDLARQGIEIERKPVQVEIVEAEVLDIRFPFVKIRVLCSKGTYIRTLCHDIGKHLGCGACMTSLERTGSGQFRAESALTLAQLEALREDAEGLRRYILPVDALFMDLPMLRVKAEHQKPALNGNALRREQLEGEICAEELSGIARVRIYDSAGHFLGVYEYAKKELLWKPYKLFIGET